MNMAQMSSSKNDDDFHLSLVKDEELLTSNHEYEHSDIEIDETEEQNRREQTYVSLLNASIFRFNNSF